MAKVLALSFFPAFLPARDGGQVRLFGLYDALSRHHSVVLLTSGHLGAQVEHLCHNARFTEIRIPKDDAFSAAWAHLAPNAGQGDLSAPSIAAASATPNLLHQYFLEQYAQADIIIHDSPFLIGYDLLIGHDRKPRIYNSYNVEADVYGELHKDQASTEINQIVLNAESLLCRHADIVTVCSQEDGDRFRELYGYSGRIEWIPNGVDSFQLPERQDPGNGLVFIGSAHRPNRTAVDDIITKFAPAMPEVHFHILGSCHEPGQPCPNVTTYGVVEEATKKAIFAAARAAINPMQEGGGSSLKVTDLAANGVPLISTRMGVRGFNFESGQHYISIDGSNAVDAARDALNNPLHLAEIARAAATHVADSFTWDRIADRMASCIESAIETRSGIDAEACYLVLNDYNPFASLSGGATRIRGLYEGVTQAARIVFLCFTTEKTIHREEIFEGRGLLLAVPKTAEHNQQDILQSKTHYVSIVDILAIEQAPHNAMMCAIFGAVAPSSLLTLCEHPYMAALPRMFGSRFVYSSQNFETGLKARILIGHPQYEELIERVRQIEEFAVGCSDLVIAVSQDDAASLGAAFDLVAPIVVVPNGAAEPNPLPTDLPDRPGFNACFLGSAHVPNIDAAQFIIQQLAPGLPEVQFHIAGSVCDSLAVDLPNVHLCGVLNDDEKALLFGTVQVALNPMMAGSGSNVKVADYLKNGLSVLTTEFGARGYDLVESSDLIVRPLSEFAATMRELATAPPSAADNLDRRSRFVGKLSMVEYGRDYALLLADQLKSRRRALLVTYRYNFPQRGGGEVYLNRLVQYLAQAGVAVDVIAPKVEDIIDRDRFSSDYPLPVGPSPIPIGTGHIRSAKFATALIPDRDTRLRAIWSRQPLFEAALFDQFQLPPGTTGLAWGWAGSEGTGRWAMTSFGLVNAAHADCILAGYAPAPRLLRIEDSDGIILAEAVVDGIFELPFTAPSGLIHGQVYEIVPQRPDDARPLGVFVRSVLIDSTELVAVTPLKPWESDNDPVKVFSTMHSTGEAHRNDLACNLSELRGPFSPMLEEYLKYNVGNYDLVISHNTVFRTATLAMGAAKAAGVPSILVPHAHFEDDYYHFSDGLKAIQEATVSLVSPRAACEFLTQLGARNIEYHCPGIDIDEAFTSADRDAFKALYSRDEPFVLVLGRKAQAKGYTHVIEAVRQLRAHRFPNLRLVMIGPDDDKLPVSHDFVDYVGLVDRTVVRGAYQDCAMLANMSQSESFGIVILEAGLAARPVVVNAYCAAFADLVQDGKTGFLVTPDTLSAKVAEILTDHNLAERLGKAGRKAALKYDWDEQGAKFVKRCLRLMDRGSKQQ